MHYRSPAPRGPPVSREAWRVPMALTTDGSFEVLPFAFVTKTDDSTERQPGD